MKPHTPLLLDGLVLLPPSFDHFLRSSCFDPGAIWLVRTTTAFDLGSADRDGQVEPSVHDGWLLVKQFFLHLRQSAADATAMISTKWRGAKESQVIEGQIQSLDLDAYSDFGSEGRCLSVISKVGDGAGLPIAGGGDLDYNRGCAKFSAGGMIRFSSIVHYTEEGYTWTPVLPKT